jgi:hypothetical protein
VKFTVTVAKVAGKNRSTASKTESCFILRHKKVNGETYLIAPNQSMQPGEDDEQKKNVRRGERMMIAADWRRAAAICR